MKLRRGMGLVALGLLALGGAEPPDVDRPIVDAMRAELARATSDLKLADAPPPYFVGYWVVDQESRDAAATLGALVYDRTLRSRFARVDLRVGSPALDNSSFAGTTGAAGEVMVDDSALVPRRVPIDDDPNVLRRELWLATDAAYKLAVEALEKKRAAKRSEITEEHAPDSFSRDRTGIVVMKNEVKLPVGDAASVVKRVSATFSSHPHIQESGVRVLATTTRRRLVTSDGGLIVEPTSFGGLEITAETQADDGMPLERSAFVAVRSGVPAEDVARREAERVARELEALRVARVGEDYGGPVLFEGSAAAQLVFELLGESLSGTPPPGGNDYLDSPLGRKLGKRILPRGTTIVDDPTQSALGDVPLLGHYAADDEGIPAARVTLVDDGYLRAFFMSRTPRDGVAASNGHGRSGLVGWARGRPANLVLSSRSGLSRQALRARLLSAVRDEGGDRGMIVTELAPRTGASSGASMPAPHLVYEVTPDGKETLVRGLTLSSLPVRALRTLLAVGREPSVFGFVQESDSGLDTGVSVVSPALLVDDVELRGPKGPHRRPPLVPRPAIGGATATPPGAAPGHPAGASLQQRTPSE